MVSGLSNCADDGLIVSMDGSGRGVDSWYGMERNAISVLSALDGWNIQVKMSNDSSIYDFKAEIGKLFFIKEQVVNNWFFSVATFQHALTARKQSQKIPKQMNMPIFQYNFIYGPSNLNLI